MSPFGCRPVIRESIFTGCFTFQRTSPGWDMPDWATCATLSPSSSIQLDATT